MNEQEKFWQGQFGDKYTARNRVNWLQRVPFWTGILYLTGANTVLEVGCNIGSNLLAIRTVKPCIWALDGSEINEKASAHARALGLNVNIPYIYFSRKNYDLVFTVGCLIHINPYELSTMMQQIVDHSGKYVLAVEYAADEEQEIEYRGHRNKLWKRPYGKMYQDMGLKLIEIGELPKDSGFDNCTYWLLEK